MIDFACKKIDLDEIIKCGLGLSQAEVKIFKYFINHSNQKDIQTSTIAKELNLNLSTIQKATKKLYEKNVLEKYQKNLEKGGYIYVYSLKPKDEIKKIILHLLENFQSKVKEEIDNW